MYASRRGDFRNAISAFIAFFCRPISCAAADKVALGSPVIDAQIIDAQMPAAVFVSDICIVEIVYAHSTTERWGE